MNLILVLNSRFSRARSGKIYGFRTAINYTVLKPYLENFEHIYIISRVADEFDIEFDESIEVSGDRVTICPVPFYKGPYNYIKAISSIKKTIKGYLDMDAAVICRAPGALSRLVIDVLVKSRRKFGIEVVADPFDIFNPSSFKHPLSRFLRYYGRWQLKNSVEKADCVLYVTERALQKRYPAERGAYSTFASDVCLDKEAFVTTAKRLNKKDSYLLTCLGSLDQLYKSPDIVLEAIKRVRERGIDVRLLWMGDGVFKNQMLELSSQLGIKNYVSFVGQVKPASAVRENLDKSDLFLIPSRTEGLPRALVEAMARGLPAIGTEIGGIPELLPENSLVKINDVESLASKIFDFLSNPDIANANAVANLTKANEFRFDTLMARKHGFYNELKKVSEK